MHEYIEKENALKKLMDCMVYRCAVPDKVCERGMIDPNEAIRRITEAPVADVAPVIHAHWNGNQITGWICSNPKCGEMSCCKGAFCPNCGAKMDEEV